MQREEHNVAHYATPATPDAPCDYVRLGSYSDSLVTWRVDDDGFILRIVPRHPQYVSYIIFTIFFAAIYAAIVWITGWVNDPQIVASRASIRWVFGAIMAATIVAIWAIVLIRHRNEMRRGPWLLLDRRRRVVKLPRLGMTIPIDRIVRVQELTAKRGKGDRRYGSFGTELQLVAIEEGGTERTHLILSAISAGQLRSVTQALADADQFPVSRVWPDMFRNEYKITALNDLESAQPA